MPEQISEKMVTEAWQSLLTTGNKLLTESGEFLEIIYPGRASDVPGSDFQDAVIQVNRRTFKGNIELHVNSSDWHNHGHDRNPVYNNVVLHVAFNNDGPDQIKLQNGSVIPAVTIDRFLQIGHQTVISDRVPCYGAGFNAPQKLGNMVDNMGVTRFHEKTAQFQEQLRTTEPGQCLYLGIMTALGYAKNKEPFRALAEKVPLTDLEPMAQRDPITALARLIGTAGLLPSQRPECDYAPEEDYIYVERLENLWENLVQMDVMDIRDWQPFRVRPANSPLRRIAGMCLLLHRYRTKAILARLVQAVRDTPSENIAQFLEACVMVTDDGYWSGRYDFGKGYPGLSKWLIGKSRAADIVINVLLPFVYVWGKENGETGLSEKTLVLFQNYPASESNTIQRHMQTQFGLKSSFVKSARRQQGLLYLYKKWCTQGRCRECEIRG